MSYDVCTAVIGDLSVDARVWKEVRSLTGSGHSVKLVGCRYDTRGIRRTSRDGVDVVEVSLGRLAETPPKWRQVAALATVWGEILHTEARVYHSHNIHVLPACQLAARRHHARLVYDAHELYGERRAGDRLARRLALRVARFLEGVAVTNADAVITTNASRALALQARHGLREIHVLGNVPYLVEEVQPLDPGYPDSSEILLYQGGIYATERPFHACIQALRLLPDVHFVIVGFGRERQVAMIHRWAQEADVAARVHVLPSVPFERLVHTAALAKVGVVPIPEGIDLGYHLGDSNKLHEYLMAGLPVIASDVPEVRSVVTKGVPPVGELFDAKDPATIAAAYQKVVADPSKYQRRRGEARRIALEQYHWGIADRRLRAIYEGLIGPSSVATSRSPARDDLTLRS